MSFEDKQLVFAGAGGPGMGTPWGTLGAITKKLLEAKGYRVHIESRSARTENARYVGDGRADLGATHPTNAVAAFRGTGAYAGEPPRDRLRVIACIELPSWIGVAVRAGGAVEAPADVATRRLPVRVKLGNGPAFDAVLAHYGLSRELIESWGGTLLGIDLESPITSWVQSGEFDLFVDTIYAAYTPEARHWWEASVLHDLRFFPLPTDVIQRISAAGDGDPGLLPNKLVRGVQSDLPTVTRLPQIIYTRDDAPEASVYEVAATLDAGRASFRQTHIPFSYDPKTVARDVGIPLHPGAARHYREAGYL